MIPSSDIWLWQPAVCFGTFKMTLPFTLMIFDGFPCLLFPIIDHGTSADRSYRHQTPNDGSQERKWGLQAAVALNILVVEMAKMVEMVKHGSIIFFLCWFCCSCSSCCCCWGKETLLVWSLQQNMDQKFVDCGKLHAASKLQPLGYDHVFLFGLKLNRTNRRCRTETPMYISSTRVPCQCQVFSFQTCFLFILFTSQFFEPPKGTQMW